MTLRLYKSTLRLKQNFPRELISEIFPCPSLRAKAVDALDMAKSKWECYRENRQHYSKQLKNREVSTPAYDFTWNDLEASKLVTSFSAFQCPEHPKKPLTGQHLRLEHRLQCDEPLCSLKILASNSLTNRETSHKARQILREYLELQKRLIIQVEARKILIQAGLAH